MGRAYRVLWLPALAVLLPCAVIGLLGYHWLALEREATGHRSAAAAQAASASLRSDLAAHLLVVGGMVAKAVGDLPASRPIFQPPPAVPTPVAAAFLYTSSGSLVVPEYERAYQRAIDAYRLAAASPAWQRARTHIEDLEQRGRTSDALAAAEAWLTQATEPSVRAAVLLTLARLASSAGQRGAADRYASEIGDCCAAARDEYGMSFALYAAWGRAGFYAGTPGSDARLASLAREIAALIDRGDLGAATDQTELDLLARRAGGRGAFADLLPAMASARARVTRQIETARAVSAWLKDVELPEPRASKPAIGSIGHGASQTLAAIARADDDRIVVMLMDTPQLASWVGAWSAGRRSFDITLTRAADPADGSAVILTPLFAETPAFELVVHQRGLDPATDRRRQRLFLAAVLAGLVLTLLLGYVALRDVSRELRTATVRSTFAAGITHELKTPLASIRLLAETVRWGRARPEAAGELLDTIVEETDRLSRLVDNVLSSSQIESGTRVYSPRVVSVPGTVRSAVRRFEYVLRKEGFTLVESFDDDTLHAYVDPDAFGQAVLNLLGNAVKYSGLSREIRLRISRDGGRARVSVEDDGIGIPSSEHARIFDSFYRARDTAAHTTGAGLGLALVRHFAEAHGGRVSVSSRSGSGSTFSVWLPLAEAANG